jgi:hypothetical protein
MAKSGKLRREPPEPVKKVLRREVGFGCPVPGCGSPYLMWHHFDPSWREQKHHNPEGMIALCGEHHAKADAGAFTSEQLRRFKAEAAQNIQERKARFDWMRNRLLVVAGGNFAYDCPVIFDFNDEPRIWITRDAEDYLMLNIQMLSISGQPRAGMRDNWWIAKGNPDDLVCPPSGRLVQVQYVNGDDLKVEFFELESFDALRKRYPFAGEAPPWLAFPLTAVEVDMTVGGTWIRFGARDATFGAATVTGNYAYAGRVAVGLRGRLQDAMLKQARRR